MPREHVPETGWVPVQANGLTHAVFDDGDGPLVLLQHGFPDTAHTWDAVVPALVAAGYRAVRPFGRGIAPTERPATDAFHVRDLAQDLVALIDAIGAQQAVVVGHDWGAAAAWGAAHLAPERISKLVVLAIPHPATIRPSTAKLWAARHFVTNKMPWAARRAARHDFAEIDDMYDRWSPGFGWTPDHTAAVKNAYAAPGVLDAAMGYYRRLGPWPFRGGVEVETLVLGGETDGAVPASDYARSAKRVNAPCTVQVLPGGHFLHLEHPAAFERALLDFLGPAADHAISPL